MPSEHKYLYNGKEIQDEQLGSVNLDWYDYGARFYDPALGRFHTIDPLSEKNIFQSGYIYAANSPIAFIDYNGLDDHYYLTKIAENSNGETYTKKIYFHTVQRDAKDTYTAITSPIINTLTARFGEDKNKFDSWDPIINYWDNLSPFPDEMKGGLVYESIKGVIEVLGGDVSYLDFADPMTDKLTLDIAKEIDKDYSYVTVTGSFQSSENAEKYAEKMSETFDNVNILAADKDGNIRVTVGGTQSFLKLEDAIEQRNVVRSVISNAWTALVKND